MTPDRNTAITRHHEKTHPPFAPPALTQGHFPPVIKLTAAGNWASLPCHLSASHLLNGMKINQRLLVSAAAEVSGKMALGGGIGGSGEWIRAAAVTPYHPNGLLHAALT